MESIAAQPAEAAANGDAEADADAAKDKDREAKALASAKEREARALASIKEREKEVQRALATSLRDRDKEREHHKKDEAVQHFTALLADLVRDPELSWRDAKKQLKKDHRYSLADLLAKDDKERLFSGHTAALASKRRAKLRAVLVELGASGAPTSWRELRPLIAAHPAAPAYASAAQMEREFREHQREQAALARAAFRQLLAETRALSHTTRAALRDNPALLGQLLDSLKDDPRSAALEQLGEDREALLTTHLDELEKRGPPPPPTATEPSRRPKH